MIFCPPVAAASKMGHLKNLYASFFFKQPWFTFLLVPVSCLFIPGVNKHMSLKKLFQNLKLSFKATYHYGYALLSRGSKISTYSLCRYVFTYMLVLNVSTVLLPLYPLLPTVTYYYNYYYYCSAFESYA